MKRILLILCTGLFLANPIFGQSTFGISFNGFIPMGELKQDSPEIWGGGFGLDIALNIKESPILLGAQFGFMRYGSEVRDGDHGSLGDVRVRRNNEIGQVLGLLRIKPPVNSNFQPYFDFYSGFSYVYTRSNIREDAISEPFETSLDLEDFAFNYGAGAGIEFFLNDFLSLDLNIKALKGSRTEYLTARSVTYDTSIEDYEFEIKQSRFDHLGISFGIKLLLSSLAD